MARKRIPSPEQQNDDRQIAFGCGHILSPLAARYPADLKACLVLLQKFADSKHIEPAKRKASTKTVRRDAPLEERVAAEAFIEQ